MLLFVRALTSVGSARGRRGMLSVNLAVRLEALVIASLILTGVTVVVATEPSGHPPAGNAGVFTSRTASAPHIDAGLSALGRPGAEVAESRPAAKAPAPAKPAAARPAAGKRWLPTGTGMWTYLWQETEGGNAQAVVRKAQAMGLSHLYVRTGTRKGGFDGGPVLRRLLPAAKATDLKVIAWDFPQLKHPLLDARRLARAAWYDADPGPGTLRVAAVAPDIETGAEGTRLSTAAIEAYYTELRRRLPSTTAILATVPWPSEHRLGRYPFAQTARHADAIVPMAYWINRDPITVTRQTMQRLKRYGKPVMPAGQAYDPRIDVPSLKIGAPSKAQVDAFFRWSRGEGAQAASLWVWNTANSQHWAAIKQASRMFHPGYRPPARKPATKPAKPATPPTTAPETETTPARKPRPPRQAQRSE
jgi:hypothetical protein